ncbi:MULTISPECIES: hypothetical protein [Acidobacteriaceae]|uniref:hypothetical protein n=1 Tax=Acidobacteriaceae TaxID=204434 RepID=UPI00131CFBF3|nr:MULTISPECIES: hypothetical protein [Acidobacteriaceae]MDW5264591.1 hypothetical protein [Edaphobacter sp.]
MKLRLLLACLLIASICAGSRPLAAEVATLTFTPIAPHTLGDAPFQISAISPSSGAVTYTVLGGPAILSHDVLTITGGGIVRLLAQQEPAGSYKAMTAHTDFTVSTTTSQTMRFTQRGDVVKSAISSDTPNFLFLDSNGQFFLQNADSQYDKVPANHVWELYTGKDAHDPKLKLSKINSQFDTQLLCESGSPVYRKLYSVPGITPGHGGYADGNFCDLVGVWVDPDSGDWYGVVHNELYPNIPRIDVISYAISKDHGKTWTLRGPIATSPYGAANKKDAYYDYGEGDPRLVVDTGSGYFYLFYNSRIMKPSGKGFSGHEWEHVSRARIRDKMAPASWEKYYNGSWSRLPGIDWTCDPSGPVPCKTGDTASSLASSIGGDNDPTISQTFVQPTSKQTAAELAKYSNSTLHTASVSWNVYLGKYIAFAEDRDLLVKSGDFDDFTDRMSFYVSDNLATQKWTYAGSVPYRNASWYRWLVDSGNLTSSKTIGSTFLAYCSINCSNPKNDSEYIKIAVSLSSNATPPVYFSNAAGLENESHAYSIVHADSHRSAASSQGDSWEFVAVPGDAGFFNIRHGKKYLGVAGGNAGRAWGAKVKLSSLISSAHGPTEMSRQQWYFERIDAGKDTRVVTAQYRLINRYSGLALSFAGDRLAAKKLADAVTAPIRDWDASAGTFKVWKAADQECAFNDVSSAEK